MSQYVKIVITRLSHRTMCYTQRITTQAVVHSTTPLCSSHCQVTTVHFTFGTLGLGLSNIEKKHISSKEPLHLQVFWWNISNKPLLKVTEAITHLLAWCSIYTAKNININFKLFYLPIWPYTLVLTFRIGNRTKLNG